MKGFVIALAILIIFPLAGTLTRAAVELPSPTPHPPNAADPLSLAAIRDGSITDGELLRVLASRDYGANIKHMPPVVVPPGVTLEGMLQKLAARAGGSLAGADLSAYAALDPRVAGPALTLLVAIDEAWTMRDAAFEKLTPAQQSELVADLRCHCNDARAAQLAANVDLRPLVNGAIMLEDTLETVVDPALQQAFANGAWPAVAVGDPVGVLYLGSPGSDTVSKLYIAQIDPAGNDRWLNNAGGTTVDEFNPTNLQTPIAISVDFNGDDEYTNNFDTIQTLGGAAEGIGILLDYGGNDNYDCARFCEAASLGGIGLLRDFAANDSFFCEDACIGTSATGYAVQRNDAGDDSYKTAGGAGGIGEHGVGLPVLGICWDRAGTDSYNSTFYAWGDGTGAGRGWLVDEGPEIDVYIGSSGPAVNNGTWIGGFEPLPGHDFRGWGNDNAGGLTQDVQNYWAEQPSTTF